MLDGKPTVVLSYSLRHQEKLAAPIAEALESYGFRSILVNDEPLPDGIESNPSSKVEWFFERADMAVFLATPDDRLQSGEIHTRPNIIDEHRLGQQLPHLRSRLLVFKAKEVSLPSNINPVYERLPLDDLDWIASRIVQQARAWRLFASGASPRPDESAPASGGTATAAASGHSSDSLATHQAEEALSDAASVLGGTTHPRRTLDRASLAIAGLTAEGGEEETLGVHFANRLFTARHDLELRDGERRLLLRTYLANTDGRNVPGAVWLSDLSRGQTIDLLASLASDDESEAVASQALRILGRLRLPSAAADAKTLVLRFLCSDSEYLREAGFDYLVARGGRDLRDLLDKPVVWDHDRTRAAKTAALLDIRSRPGHVFRQFMTDPAVRVAAIRDGLLSAASRISQSDIDRGLTSPTREVGLLAAGLSTKRGKVSAKIARQAIATSQSPRLRLALTEALLAAGDTVTVADLDQAFENRDDDESELPDLNERHALEVAAFRSLPPGMIEAHIRWTSVKGAAAYEALGLKEAAWAHRVVRKDFRDDFDRLKVQGRAEMHENFLADLGAKSEKPVMAAVRREVDEAVERQWSIWVTEGKLAAFMLRGFRLAALRIISARSVPSDIKIARQVALLGDRDAQEATLPLFKKYGTAHDQERLCGIAESAYSEPTKLEAASLAFQLAFKKDKRAIVQRFQGDYRLRVWAVRQLATLDDGPNEAWKLCRADNAEVRIAAASVAWNSIPADRWDTLLSAYMQHRHFYNVVRAMDHRISAPAWLREVLPPASETD